MQKILPIQAMLIPDNAESVYQGIIFDVYQWPQVMFDGSTKVFEMLKRPDTVQVVVARDKQLLLVKDEQPGRPMQIHFPGGRADIHDESWLATAKRELLEETGLVCRTWRLVDVRQPLIKVEWFTPIFLATDIIEEHPQRLDVGGEKITPEWQDFDTVREAVLSGQTQMMQYLISFFNTTRSYTEFIRKETFIGIEANR